LSTIKVPDTTQQLKKQQQIMATYRQQRPINGRQISLHGTHNTNCNKHSNVLIQKTFSLSQSIMITSSTALWSMALLNGEDQHGALPTLQR